MDLVPQFNDLLRQHQSQPLRPYVFSLKSIDAFLQEAYNIHNRIIELRSYLRSIRQSYLSVTPSSRRKQVSRTNNESDNHHLTNSQRDEIDANAKQLLRELNGSITTLMSAEQVRRDTETQVASRKRAKQGLGGLGRWAMGGALLAKSPAELEEEAKADTIKTHRDSIFWYLSKQLEECGGLQRDMMEIRIMREVEKDKSALNKVRGALPIPDQYLESNGNGIGGQQSKTSQYPGLSAVDMEQSARSEIEQQLTDEQLQLFEEENHDMMKHYEDTLDKVKGAEKSLFEISELQSTLTTNLSIQQEHIDLLVQDHFQTAENVDRGNKELERAAGKRSTAQMIFYGTCGFCLALIAWDLLI